VTVPKREPSALEEKEAHDRLARANRVHWQGKLSQARAMHINVVRRFPGTAAAREVIRTRPEIFGTEVARELSGL
jgi:hypothetical protein